MANEFQSKNIVHFPKGMAVFSQCSSLSGRGCAKLKNVAKLSEEFKMWNISYRMYWVFLTHLNIMLPYDPEIDF